MRFASILVTAVTAVTAIASSVDASQVKLVEQFNPIVLPDAFKFQTEEWQDHDYTMTASNIAINFDEQHKEDLVANRCYFDASGTIAMCVYAANLTAEAGRKMTGVSAKGVADDFNDCLSNTRTIWNYQKCRNFRIREAYYSWFRLQCGVNVECINPETCEYFDYDTMIPYSIMPDQIMTPFVSIMRRASRDRLFFVRKCQRTDLYNVTSDKYTCVNPPEQWVCDLYHDRIKPTEPPTNPGTHPPPTDPKPPPTNPEAPISPPPEDPSKCAVYGDCRQAVAIESNLVPNYCDCHRFWQCQPLSSLELHDNVNLGWQVVPKVCPYRDFDKNLQYFDLKLKVCVNDRNNTVAECTN